MNFSLGLTAYFDPKEGLGNWASDQGWNGIQQAVYGFSGFLLFSLLNYHIKILTKNKEKNIKKKVLGITRKGCIHISFLY